MNASKPKSSNHRPPPSSSRLAACHRHPGEPVTGFCAACLSERLAGSAPTEVKSVFETGQSSNAGCGGIAELSRSKSCSRWRGGFVGVVGDVEPRRKSCDVRGGRSLSSLLGIGDGDADVGYGKGGGFVEEGVSGVVLGKEKELGAGETRILDEEGQIGGHGDEEWRTMKELIDLECWSKNGAGRGKDLKNIAACIWAAAASGLSKKLRKWRQKQRAGTVDGIGALNFKARMNVRETQSEVGDFGFGRRSCDADPRFSINVGRASADSPSPPRFSLDEQPRASWDGHLIGSLWLQRPNQMLAVVEDDHYVEDVSSVKRNEIDKSPGGSEQTRDYYGKSLSRRRRSPYRSGSRRASSVKIDEIEELRAISNTRVTPATVDQFHRGKVSVTKNIAKMPILSPIRTVRLERVETSDSASNGASSITEEKSSHKVQIKKVAGWRKAWTDWSFSKNQAESRIKFTCAEEPKATDKITSSGTRVSSSSSSSITFGSTGSCLHSYSHR